MKQINKDELYAHFSEFLKNKGIELKNGTYTQTIEKGCSVLTDAVNLAQQGMERAKTEIDKRLDQMRQVIHEKTAPKTRPAATTAEPPKTTSASPPPTSAAQAQAQTKAAKKAPHSKAKKKRISRRK